MHTHNTSNPEKPFSIEPENNGSGRLYVLIILLVVLVPAFLIRLHPVTSESFQFDAVVSQISADRGIVANALDSRDTLFWRRYHPPLLSYIIIANNGIFGPGPFTSRLFSIIAGSLCCLAVSLSVLKILGHRRWSLAAALFGGWMICLLPVHLYISRTSNWDAAYSFFNVCSLLLLSLYLKRGTFGNLLTAGVFATLAFLTCEIGLLIVPAFLFTLFYDIRRRPGTVLIRNWLLLVLAAVLITAALWPAGIFRLNILRTIAFRVRDSAMVPRNLPWYMFYAVLFDQAPAFAVFSALSCMAVPFAARLERVRYGPGTIITAAGESESRGGGGKTGAGESGENNGRVGGKAGAGESRGDGGRYAGGWLISAAPFWIYAATAFALSTVQRLVYIHHIADLFAPLTVVTACSAFVFLSAAGRGMRRAAAVISAAALALSIPAALNSNPDVVGPQEHPGFLGIRDFFENRLDARAYYHHHIVMSYYLPGMRFDAQKPGRWIPERVEAVKAIPYDFVVTDHSLFSPYYPDLASLSSALAPEYKLEHAVEHRRTGRPVAWIYSRRATGADRN